jgi:hypothetical protein
MGAGNGAGSQQETGQVGGLFPQTAKEFIFRGRGISGGFGPFSTGDLK